MEGGRSSSRSNSGSSGTAAEPSHMNDVEAQPLRAGEEHHQPHDPEKSLPTHSQGRGPAAATASGGDTLHQPSTNHQRPRESSTVTTINGDLETQEDKYTLVNWDGDNDPLNPINFTETKKWIIMVTIGTATLACTCASSMVASTYEGMMEDFHISREVATLSLTL
jgi:hypothetical protein